MPTAEPVGTRKSKWGEGPVWHDGRLTYVDIVAHTIVTYDPTTNSETVRDVGQQVGFVVPCQSGRWIYGGESGLFFLDPRTGESSPLFDPEPNLPDNRFNDGKTSPDGRLFAGTISRTKKTGTASLYRINSDLRCQSVFAPVTNSNGLAWSSDTSTFYYIDTPSKEVKAFAYDPSTGAIKLDRVVIDTSYIEASPDGMCIDSEDHLWIAFCHGGCVLRFDPATGREVQRITVPALETTSCAFAGPDLYITTGTHASVSEEWGGHLFVVRGIGSTAAPATPFRDL